MYEDETSTGVAVKNCFAFFQSRLTCSAQSCQW